MTSTNGSRYSPDGDAPRDREDRGDLPTCPWQESLALHAFGSLSAAETPGLLSHLAGGCPVCLAERARLGETLAIMDACEAQDSAVAPTPSASVKSRLFEELARATSRPFDRPWQHLKSAPGQAPDPAFAGLATVRGGKEGYERTGIEGIEVKPLFVDGARRRVSMLVKMAPGTAYPAHRHASCEECFVVSGDIRVGDRILYAGDYQVASSDSIHGVQSTEKGCVLFIVSSQDDELV